MRGGDSGAGSVPAQCRNDHGHHSPAEEKRLRGPLACVQPASRGAGIFPSFCQWRAVRSGELAAVQLGGWKPGWGSASFAALSPPLLPLPCSVPPRGARTHSAPMMSSGGNLPCSKTGIIQRSRGERRARAEADEWRAFRWTQHLFSQISRVKCRIEERI